jgi:hypothetical protein
MEEGPQGLYEDSGVKDSQNKRGAKKASYYLPLFPGFAADLLGSAVMSFPLPRPHPRSDSLKRRYPSPGRTFVTFLSPTP